MSFEQSCAQLVEHQLACFEVGLSTGTSGNLSVKVDDGVLITPSGVPAAATTADDLCLVDLDGEVRAGRRRPSSELPMHLAIYRATDVRAVVHTHAEYATAISLTHDELPAVHYAINSLGGAVRVAPYATFGTPALAAGVVAALEGRGAAILQNHGAVTTGATLAEAFERAQLLEWLCRLFWRALQAGTPRILTAAELAAVREQATALRYGQYDE